MSKKFLAALTISFYLLVIVCTVGATTLTSTINMDNSYTVYISTDDTVAGTSFGSLADWHTSDVHTITLAAGTDYYLHVYGEDAGGMAGFLGEFSLSGTDHKFSNNSVSLLTSTTDWVGNNTGWDAPMTALTDLGQKGVYPWYFRYDLATDAVSGDARWIWSGNAYDDNVAYFSTKISAVPVPGAFILLGSGLAGLAFFRRKRARNIQA